jgi:hypothetical protein
VVGGFVSVSDLRSSRGNGSKGCLLEAYQIRR